MLMYISLKKLMLICFYMATFACSNNDDNQAVDVFNSTWKLVSVESNKTKIKISESSYSDETSYMLNFLNSSSLQLNTGVNIAKGKYVINGNQINISDYHEYTEATTLDEEQQQIDNLLLEHLNKVNKFSYFQKELILSGSDFKFTFSRQ
ncbi:META domain-containing protein [Arenibacter sp. N53]|nr:META domain-containing protein [Arenibacter sp. N53]